MGTINENVLYSLEKAIYPNEYQESALIFFVGVLGPKLKSDAHPFSRVIEY